MTLFTIKKPESLAPIFMLLFLGECFAGPRGESVVGGAATVSRHDRVTQIHQRSERVAIDWQSFNVDRNERVEFIQPSSNAVALNRILDSRASSILGQIDANGRLFLVNSRGLIFGKNATVNAAAFIASDLNIDVDKFMAGELRFIADQSVLSEGVVNRGMIEAAVGGSVTLLGTIVQNSGRITAEQGSIQLTSASEVVVTFDDNQQVGLLVKKNLLSNNSGADNAVVNSGQLSAHGGKIILSGHVAKDLFTHAVNNEGILEARSLNVKQGYIELSGDGGDINNSGQLDVSGKNLAGGNVLVNAENIYHSGDIEANGATAGDIYLKANDKLLLNNAASIEALSSNNVGGNVELFAKRIGLLGNSQLNVSGDLGGGTLLVGGDYQGAGLYRSEFTVVGADVVLQANAINHGDGGKVIIWSDNNTIFQGSVLAKGGYYSGNGGFVEVSGKQQLQFTGAVDTSAPVGAMGTLLLDPDTITITDGASAANDTDVLDGTILEGDGAGGNYFISEAVLESLTSNIILEAADSITINNLTDDVLCFYCSAGSGTVTFRVSGSNNPAFFTMNTGDTIQVDNGNLTIDINAVGGDTATITTGDLLVSGDINLLASTDGSAGFFGSTVGGVTISTGQINSTAGNLNINATASANVGFSFTGTTGDADISTGAISLGSSGNVNITASSTMNSGFSIGPTAGDANITTQGIDINGAGTITMLAESILTGFAIVNTQSGTINLSGNYSAGNTGNNGFIDLTADNIDLQGATVLQLGNDGSGGDPIQLNNSPIRGGGNTLTLAIDQASFGSGVDWSDISNISALTISQSNNIYVDAVGAVAGDVTLSQTDLNQIDNFTSFLTLNAGNDLVLGSVTFNNYSDLILNAGSAFLTTDAANTTGANLRVNAGTTIAVNNVLASGGGDIDLQSVGDITQTAAITSAGGDIALTSTAASVLMANTATLNSGAGSIALSADGDIEITGITTTNNSGSALSITSLAGSILDAGDLSTDITATSAGAVTTLSAVTGIGDDASATDFALEVNVDQLSATNTGANNIALNFIGDTTLSGGINNSAINGGLLLSSTGNMTIDTALSTNDGVIDVAAASALTMNTGSSIDAGAATINLSAVDDIALTSVVTTNNSGSAIQITSSGGAIIDGDTVDDTDITAAANDAQVLLSAAQGIGVGNALEIDAATVSAVTTSGDIALTDNNTLNVAAANTADGAITIQAADTLSVTAIQGATVTLISGADIVDADPSGVDVTVSSGALTLTAASGIGQGDALETDTREIVVTSNVAHAINNNGDLTLSGLNAHSGGNLDISTGGDLTIDSASILDTSLMNLTAGGQVDITSLDSLGDLTVTATDLTLANTNTNGLTTTAATSITGAVNTITQFTSADLTLASNATLGSGGSISVGELALDNSGTNGITSGGDVTTAGINGSGANLDLVAAGGITTGAVSLGNGNFTARIDSDDIGTDALSVTSISAANIQLSGGADANDTAVIDGLISGNNISITDFGSVDLRRVIALGNVDIQAVAINLNDSIQSANGLSIRGTTQLLNDIALDSSGAGTTSSRLEIAGSWLGNGNNLTLTAGEHVVCSDEADISGVNNFTIASSIKSVLGNVSANTIDANASQEIHLNQSLTANSARFNADSNADGIGVLSILEGQSVNATTLTVTDNTFQLSASTPAECNFPTGLPVIPEPPPVIPEPPPVIPPPVVPEAPQVDLLVIEQAQQEAEEMEETTIETFASNRTNITYLDSRCAASNNNQRQNSCALDESVRHFLGTFLIDYQLPAN